MAKPEINLSRLCTAMSRSRLVLRTFRDERREAVKEYVGRHWSEDGTLREVPVNLLAQYISIVSRNLIAKNPRVMLSTFKADAKPVVSAMQSWVNKRVEQIRLANTLQRVVIDALFSIGICKVALATPADSASMAWSLGAGQPFAERVDLDDFVFDVHARDFNEVSFIGHRYRCPLAAVKDSKLFSNARKELQPSMDQPYNLQGDEKVTAIGRMPYGILEDEFEEMVDLWEVYLPRHRLVITLADDQVLGEGRLLEDGPLREQNWLGPDSGPYHVLGFGTVPGNAMPKAPVQDLIDLHRAANNCYRKLIRQAHNSKDLTFVRASGTEDGDKIRLANDQDIVPVSHPDGIQQTKGQGPNQAIFAMAEQLKQLFDFLGGNLALMGGLAPQSKTATQDEMLQGNASRQIASMQDDVITLTTRVANSLCWYWYHDPANVMQSEFTVPGTQISINRTVTPQMRSRYSYSDMEVRVDPYSLQHQTPQQRLAQMQQLTQTIVPLLTLMAQQGIGLDLNKYLEKWGQYLDDPDIAEILTITEPPQQDTPGGPETGPGPAATQRKYIRENRSVGTSGGQSQQVMAKALGVDTGGASGGIQAAQNRST